MTTRTWLVWVDDIPHNPGNPLAWQDACTAMTTMIERYPHQKIDLRQCAEATPGPTLDLLCRRALELGMTEAYLDRHDTQPWIRAARVIRAVHAHLPGQRPMGLREGATLGKAVVQALADNPAQRHDEPI